MNPSRAVFVQNPSHRAVIERIADALAVLLAVSLPWSTSVTSVVGGLWLIFLVPTLDVATMRRVLATPAGGLPALLWLLGLVGMLWATGLPLHERLDGSSSFFKLLVIPLLIAQFLRSDNGAWVLKGFVASCTVLLVFSWYLILIADPSWSLGKTTGVPVKDYIAQSSEFTICAFILAASALALWRERQLQMAVLQALLGMVFIANVFDVSTSRTALVVIPVLAGVLAFRQLTFRAGLGLLAAATLAGGLAFAFAPLVRQNVMRAFDEVRHYSPEGERTRAGERLEFWRKSVGFIAEAPVLGHGTGSIAVQFRKTVSGEHGMAALASTNPHNQTFAVAIQLGLIGTIVLFAMWMAHVLVFRGGGLAAWTGLAVVTQNIVGSLFNSHLFDFTHGWGYVIGVGVAAGIALKQKRPG